MTSELLANPPTTAYVWIWLPGATEPVVCGRLDEGRPITFTYARSYRERADAVPVFAPELPLRAGTFEPLDGDRLPLCIDDAMPDSWGRRLVNHRLEAGYSELSELSYLLASGSDRTGAIDLQASSTEYVPRQVDHPTLEELAEASHRIETGAPLDDRLEAALLRGTSIGGARPKALLDGRDGDGSADGDGRRNAAGSENGAGAGASWIAKFSSTTDTYPVVQGEFVAMTLARRCGLDVAQVELVEAAGRAVLVVERFDRPGDGSRRRIVSALTVLGLCAFPSGRYATYADLTHRIRASFHHPDRTLRELFGRVSFNIVCGNTDDHGRNHAAFVAEDGLTLTPAYDICPQARSGGVAAQAMAYGPDGERASRTAPLIDAAPLYHLDRGEAEEIVRAQQDVIRASWDEVCDEAHLTAVQREAFWGRQFLHPSVFDA